MSKKMLVAWLKPDGARLKFACKAPKDWEKMDGDDRLTYFEKHKRYAGEARISTDADSDWYEAIDPDVDFEVV